MNAPDQAQNVGEIDRRTYLGGSDAAAILGALALGASAGAWLVAERFK